MPAVSKKLAVTEFQGVVGCAAWGSLSWSTNTKLFSSGGSSGGSDMLSPAAWTEGSSVTIAIARVQNVVVAAGSG